MSILFRGLGDNYGGQSNTGNDNASPPPLIFPAHVLEICTGTDSPLYETTRDIGKIRFRELASEGAVINKPEKDIEAFAFPLDRSFIRYPYPGEQVLIFVALSEIRSPEGPIMQTGFFYSFVVSAFHNISYNQHPFLGVDVDHLDPDNPFITYDTAKTRFDKRSKDINSVKNGSNSIKVYKQLEPQEGDYIMQGRFGTSIRFSSTSPSANNQTPWNSNNPAGVSGDGIIVLRADRDSTTEEKSMLTNENVDVDDSSIYLCTSQKVEMTLACSKRLLSWRARYDLPDQGTDEAEGIVGTTKDTSQLWQKIVDSTEPIESSFENPSGAQ